MVFDGWSSIQKNYSRLWQAISPAAEDQHLLLDELTNPNFPGLPSKLSTQILGYPAFRYPSNSQQSLRTLSDLLIEDAPNTPSVQKRFYEECYCESGALAQEALVGKNILAARYAAMFNPNNEGPKLESISAKGPISLGVSAEVVAEALGRRPIVIIGDVGVGKTSFIRNLINVRATEEFANAIFLYIDLGTEANLGQELHAFFIREIERQLLETYHVNIDEDKFVRGVYHGELIRFDQGIYGRLKEQSPTTFFEKQIEALAALTSDRPAHLKASIKHLARGRKKQVVISIDNADQRDLVDQQAAFLAAQEFASSWEALVFVSLRPQTYFTSKSSGSASAYPKRILTISPPRVDLVLQKRLQFSLDLAEGRLPLEKLEGISIRLDSISLFLRALIHSLRVNREIVELLTNLTGGNIRETLDLVKSFIGSANVDSDKIIQIMRSDGGYVIPLHEFSKAALIGEYSHYQSSSSIALNLFDIRYPDLKEHFLASLILGFLGSDGQHKNTEGFVQTSDIMNEIQRMGFVRDQIEYCLRRLTNKKLIETTERITFEQGLQGLVGNMPIAFRLTTSGAYHIKKWMPTFAYLDAMIFDTPILNEKMRAVMGHRIESFDIRERYRRTLEFIKYLDEAWEALGHRSSYFDWPTIKISGQSTFSSVGRAIEAKNNSR